VPASGAIEPIAAILALRIGEPLLLLTLGAHAIHLAVGDVIFKDQAAFCTDFCITTMVGGLTARCRADENRMTGVTPVLAASRLFTNRALFHQGSSKNSMSDLRKQSTSSTRTTRVATKIIMSRSNF
jgi:hypothetical protein